MELPEQHRIAFVAPSMRGGGAERVMLDLASGFSNLGFPIDLVLVKAEGPYLQFVPDNVNVVDLDSSRTYKALPAFVRYLRGARPRAMLSTLNNVNVMVAWAKALSGVPVRLVVREPTTPSQRFVKINPLKKAFFWHLKRRSYLMADKVVAVSAGVGADLHSYLNIPAEAIEVIYNPIDAESIQTSARQPANHRWLNDNTVPVIIAVGRLSAEKDYMTLLQAFSQVRKRVRSKLIILGEGEERERLEAAVRSLGLKDDVDMPGFIVNPFSYIARANVLVLSSLYEGLPNVLIQSLVLGTPVVSTDCESGPREILNNGEYGKLVKVGDRDALAEQLVSVIETDHGRDFIRSMVDRGRSFNVDNALSAYRRILVSDLT